MLDDRSSPCHTYAVRRQLHARSPPNTSGIPPQRRRAPAGEDADARERRIAVAGGLTLNSGTNGHFAFLRTASSGPRRLPKTDLRLCIPIVRSVESSPEHADEAIVEEPQEAE